MVSDLDPGPLSVYSWSTVADLDFTQPPPNRTSVHKSTQRALLRWSVILTVCVFMCIGLLRLRDRDRALDQQFAECIADEKLYAERWPVARPVERAWIREASAGTTTLKAANRWAAKRPWRPVPSWARLVKSG